MDTLLKPGSRLWRASGRLHLISALLIIWPGLCTAASGSDASRQGAGRDEVPAVCIALGAGGANGLAHVPMLEVLDDLNIRPAAVAGSSIGAIIGALYASGMSAREIRDLVDRYFVMPQRRVVDRLLSGDALRWVDLIELELGDGGLLGSEDFMSFLYERLEATNFDQLKLPLRIVAADLWRREQVVFDAGELLPAIKASMALPGVFEPVVRNGRVLIDGGTVNPVPYDLLPGPCEITIGVDVSGVRSPPDPPGASYFETVFNSAKVMQQAIVRQKRESRQPTIFISPSIVDVRALEFYRAPEIFHQAAPAAEELRSRLEEAMSEPAPQ